jgi:hypothetical protein
MGSSARPIQLVDAQSKPDRHRPQRSRRGPTDVVTVNQLHLPSARPAIIHLSSLDVIHSFALQEMRVKQDAIPGMSTPVWFISDGDERRHEEADRRREVELRDLLRAAHAGSVTTACADT